MYVLYNKGGSFVKIIDTIGMFKKEMGNIKENGIKKEIEKGKIILQGKKSDIDEKRKKFFNKISQVKFETDSKSSLKNFYSHIQKECDILIKICSEQSSISSLKSKSKPYLDSLVKRSESLKESLDLIEKENFDCLKLVVLRSVHNSFKSLSDRCISIYEAKFIITFGAVLDYKQTKEHFKTISENLKKAERLFSQLVLKEECGAIIKKLEDIIKSKKFNEIKLNICLPQATVGKYKKIDFSTKFSRCDNDKEKAISLNQEVTEFLKMIKNQKEIYNEMQSFQKEKLKSFIDSIEGSATEECPICLEKMDLSDEDVVTLKCGHSLHKECFKTWYNDYNNHDCPVCRKPVST